MINASFNKSDFNLVYVISTCLTSRLFFLPSIRYQFDLVFIAVVGVVYSALFLRKTRNTLFRIIPLLLLYGFFNFIVAVPDNFKMGFLHPMMSLWIFTFPILIGSELILRRNIREVSVVLLYNLILGGIIFSATFALMKEYPDIMRTLTAGIDIELAEQSRSENVGGFAIAYGAGAFLVILISSLLTLKSDGINRYIVLCVTIVCSIMVIKAQFTTLLFLCAISIVLAIWVNYTNLLYRLSFIIIALVIYLGLHPILDFLVNYYQDSNVGLHLKDISESLFYETKYESARNDFLFAAIKLFGESPVWGNNVIEEHNKIVLYSCHSTIMGVAIRTGIIGVVIYCRVLWLSFKSNILIYDSITAKKIFMPFLMYCVLLAFFNPIETDIFSFIIGVICPLTTYYLYESKRKES